MGGESVDACVQRFMEIMESVESPTRIQKASVFLANYHYLLGADGRPLYGLIEDGDFPPPDTGDKKGRAPKHAFPRRETLTLKGRVSDECAHVLASALAACNDVVAVEVDAFLSPVALASLLCAVAQAAVPTVRIRIEDLTEDHMIVITCLAFCSPSLRTLSLDHCELWRVGVGLLIRAICGDICTADGALQFAVTSLSLVSCGLDDTDISLIANAMARGYGPRALSIAHNTAVTSQGVCAMCRSLLGADPVPYGLAETAKREAKCLPEPNSAAFRALVRLKYKCSVTDVCPLAPASLYGPVEYDRRLASDMGCEPGLYYAGDRSCSVLDVSGLSASLLSLRSLLGLVECGGALVYVKCDLPTRWHGQRPERTVDEPALVTMWKNECTAVGEDIETACQANRVRLEERMQTGRRTASRRASGRR